MKKVKELNIVPLLNKEELKELKGGDIYNQNSVFGCSCDYRNYSAIRNLNSTQGCSCNCI